MTQVIVSLKGDAAGVFDWVRHNHHDTCDLGLIMEKICNHYCSTLTFREQRNTVENMRQASSKGAADFWSGLATLSRPLTRIGRTT